MFFKAAIPWNNIDASFRTITDPGIFKYILTASALQNCSETCIPFVIEIIENNAPSLTCHPRESCSMTDLITCHPNLHAFSKYDNGEQYTLQSLHKIGFLEESCLVYNYKYYRYDSNTTALETKYREEEKNPFAKNREKKVNATKLCSKLVAINK